LIHEISIADIRENTIKTCEDVISDQIMKFQEIARKELLAGEPQKNDEFSMRIGPLKVS
jgi:hypothetical protein